MIRALLLPLCLFLLVLHPRSAAADPVYPKPLSDALARVLGAMMDDPAEATSYLRQAESLAQQLPDPRERRIALATVRRLGAEALLRSGEPDKAAPLLDQGLALIADIPEPLKIRGDLLMSQGVLLMQRERAAAALSNFQSAYRVFGEVREPRSQAMALQNIALLYLSANDNARAERYFAQAASAYTADPTLSLALHNGRGNVLLLLERYGEAEAAYKAALGIARTLGKPLIEARVLANLARYQVEARKFDAADATLTRGFALARAGNAVPLRRTLLATAARLAADRGDSARAAQLIRECFDGLDLATTPVDMRTAHLYAYQIFREVGETRLALAHLEALKRLSDEASKVASTTSGALMAAQFDFANQQLIIQQQKAQFQRTLFLSIGGATLVIIVLLTFGLFKLRRSRNEVRAANLVLNETNVALEKALRAKTEFLATTSHEIRTPLNGILGMTQVMLADAALAPQMRDRIGIVHDAGVTMRTLVDDILDVAKMETGNLVVDSAAMDLCATLRDVTRMWEEQARAKGLTFDLQLSHAPQWIVSDAGRLRQVVFNLLSNAVKFTEQGSVGLRAVAEGEGDARRLRLVVSDTGIGIPPAKFEEIFESFRQVDASTTRRFGGTGLGLTICRNLARALGGDIAVESDEGQGSRFIVDLPLVPAMAPVVAAPEAAQAGAMLIVDRNPIARSMLRTLFEPKVAALRFVGTSEEALAVLAEGGIAHMLIDESTLKAGEGDPLETLRTLVGAAQAAGDVASAVLWLRPDAETISKLLRTGISQIVEKPLASATLVETVLSGAGEISNPQGPDPLVSRAA